YLYYLFKIKIEIYDYIFLPNESFLKEKINETIKSYMQLCNTLDNKKLEENIEETICVNAVNKISYMLKLKDIYFFSTSVKPHIIEVHHSKGVIEFYGTLKGIQDRNEKFFRSDRTIVVNTLNIRCLDKVNKYIIMKNGEICSISKQNILNIKKIINDNYYEKVIK
ncbi:MAG: LytTR family transcriptional regulator DNA-binding domain-containing protein, partial [Clostridioides sp.]|nr:LytTR family transcriptional regulator DNA-binding domain-containing protein [Clostridioides sp.]